jgi:hypothetical protein
MTDSPIFIVGCPRSGTKLIRDMLRSHPNITFPPESHFIPRFYKLYGDPGNDKEAVKVASKILGIHWLRSFGITRTPASFSGCRTYSEIVSGIFGEWAAMEGKPRWGDKTPQYVTEIPTLIEIFPSSKIIHIYRDGRDVALSFMKQWFGPGNVFSAATAWKRMVTMGRLDGASAGRERYMEIRYETLLDNPGETLEEVCAFIGEQYSEAMLKLNFVEIDVNPSKPGGYGTKTEILRSNQGKWKREMAPGDRSVFESVAGGLLSELGYETEGICRTIGMHERLFWNIQDYYHFLEMRFKRRNLKVWLLDELLLRWADIRGGIKMEKVFGKIFPKRRN